MNKLINVIISMGLAASLVGCGNSSASTGTSSASAASTSAASTSSEGENVELTLWTASSDAWLDALQTVVNGFESENPNIKINIESFPYKDFESKIQTSLIDGTGADMYEMWGGWAVDYSPTGALTQIPDDFAKQVMDECYAPTYGAFLANGKLYGIPMEFNIENGGMLVNLNLMNEMGLTVPTTWDEMIETAKKGTKIDSDGNFEVKGLEFVNGDTVTFLYLSLILQLGGDYMNEDQTAFTFDTDESKKAFQILADLVTVDKVTNTEVISGGGTLDADEELFAGQALMCPRGPWVVSKGISSFNLELGKDFDYVAMPWYTDNPEFAAENGWSLAGNAKSPHQEEIIKFMKYFYQDDVMMQHNLTCVTVPPKKSIAESSTYLDQMTYIKPLVSSLSDSRFIGYFNSDTLKHNINIVFANYCAGEYDSIDSAMNELNTLEDQLLS